MATFPLLLAASLTTAQPAYIAPAPAARPVHPALWVVSDPDTTIYLFGTFHALDGSTNWFKDEVKTAFDRSNELVLETLVPEPPKTGTPMISGPVNASFAKRAPAPEAPAVAQVAPSASFLASTQVVMQASHSRGMSSAEGADAILRDVAENIGKPVAGLETFQFQMQMFNSLPPAPRAAQVQDPETLKNVSIALAKLQAAWNRGDTDAFTPMLEQMRAETPVSYDTMFVERNARWAQWIANRLQEPGVVFVAVGTGHLTGPDSLQHQLASLGIKAGRIN